MKTSAFTLIEILIVVAVLGVLAAAVFFVVNPQAQILKSQVSAAQATMKQMKTEVEGIRVIRQQTFREITGNGCSECSCRCVDATSNVACINAVTNTWSKISTKPLPKDPWGNVLMYDENEAEGGPSDCRQDIIYSAGPDHIRGSSSCSANSSDDLSMAIPLFRCP